MILAILVYIIKNSLVSRSLIVEVREFVTTTRWTNNILTIAGSRWIKAAHDRSLRSSIGLLTADDDDVSECADTNIYIKVK